VKGGLLMNYKEEMTAATYKSDEILGFVNVEYEATDSEGLCYCDRYGCTCIAYERCGIFGC
jgi:hypothetical protein